MTNLVIMYQNYLIMKSTVIKTFDIQYSEYVIDCNDVIT